MNEPHSLPRRAQELIAQLGLQPHFEGGHFREVFRALRRVRPEPDAGAPTSDETTRSAATTIYYLLAAGGHSRWHRVSADEIWHFYEGEPLELLCFDASRERLLRWRLGPVAADSEPVRVIPAGCWQAARPLGSYALVGCTVAPGFELDDWTLAADLPQEASRLAARAPDLAALL